MACILEAYNMYGTAIQWLLGRHRVGVKRKPGHKNRRFSRALLREQRQDQNSTVCTPDAFTPPVAVKTLEKYLHFFYGVF